MRTLRVWIGLALVTSIALAGRAAAVEPSETAPPTPTCLSDEDAEPLGVQQKTFLKRHRFELLAQGGLYAADLLSSTYAVGGAVAFYLTEDFGVQASLARVPVALDVDEALTAFFGDTRFHSGVGTLVGASLLWSPIHYKVRTGSGRDSSILHGDIELELGGGKLLQESVSQGLGFHAGLDFDLYLTRWLSLRIDLADVILVEEVVGDSRMTNNIVALAGIGFWLPWGF